MSAPSQDERQDSELVELTTRFVTWLDIARDAIPDDVVREARRTLLNVLGTAIGASRHAAVDSVIAAALDSGGRSEVGVPGRREVVDRYAAATAIGTAAHVDDFDDTHLSTVIHPGASVLGVIWPLSRLDTRDGPTSLAAFALGIESQLRVGQAMSPWHYDAGWHITGTVGAIGGAVAAGFWKRFTREQLIGAIGIAASETVGIREAFGSSVKGFHPGKAAANGLLAAELAANGFSSSSRVLEAPRGYFHVLSPRLDVGPLLSSRWLILENTYKPFPCGIVAHPAIDAALSLHRRLSPSDLDRIESISVRCNPLVLDLMGKDQPKTGLEARFSAVHAVAAALVTGRAGLEQFTDASAQSEQIVAIRDRVRLVPDESVGRESASLEVNVAGREMMIEEVEVAIGSLARPMTDADLDEKFCALVEPVLEGRSRQIADSVWSLGQGSDLADVASAIGEAGTSNSRPKPARTSLDHDARFDASSLTGALSVFASQLTIDDLPQAASHNACRTIANALALGIGAAKSEATMRALSVARQCSGATQAHVLGEDVLLGAPWAAFVNGIAIHVEDFDDTHLSTVVHPGAPIVPAALAMAELVQASGADLLAGVAAGVEVALRVGLGLGTAHFDRGWHLTGTAGHVGAAVAAARVARLTPAQMSAAISIGATEAAGLQEALGTMTKAFHAGKAALDGVEAALLARHGLDGPPLPLEGRRGLFAVASEDPVVDAVLAGLGSVYELSDNAFKPYACGIVSHPVIDAALAVRDRVLPSSSAIDEVVVRVNPVVLDVMGVRDPTDGLQSKFSYTHCFAVGLLEGAAGPVQYDDEHAQDPQIAALRAKVRAELDPAIRKDECFVTVRIGANTFDHHVEHATASASSPMTDDQLRAKMHLVADPVIGAASCERLFELTLGIEKLDDLDELFRATNAASRR